MTAVDTTPQQAVAHLKFARMGPRKLRRVADAIRGKSVREALIVLQFAGVFASEPLEKLLKSAVANAENNHNMSSDGLFITKITVDSGPGGGITKRLDPRAQGRANFKRKRMSHVTIGVGPNPPKHQPRQRAGAAIAMSTVESRRAAVASAKPAPSRRKTSAAPAAAAPLPAAPAAVAPEPVAPAPTAPDETGA
jgi:large subunit ribosomal protein L22